MKWDNLPSGEPGLINTHNAMGYMLAEPDELMQDFIKFALRCQHPVVDVGCAYGVASLALLNILNGQKREGHVIAIDPDPAHLAFLEKKALENGVAGSLRLYCGKFPADIHFQDASIEACLLSRVLHFFTGAEIELTFQAIHRALVPGGQIFISSLTPYIKLLEAFIGTYETQQNAGASWPGAIKDIQQYLPTSQAKQNPTFFHVMTPDILANALKKSGFEIIKAEFSTRDYPANIQLDGREDVVVIARKP